MDNKKSLDEATAVSEVLDRLQSTMHRLRMLGLMAFLSTAMALVSSIFFLAMRAAENSPFRYVRIEYFSFVAMVVSMSFLFLVMYDNSRRRGDALFEEASDELQWNLTKTLKNDDSYNRSERPALKARVILREYSTSIDLPLARGKNGILIYATTNVMSLFVLLAMYVIKA